MADIIDFNQARNRLRPPVDRRAFLIVEIPEDLMDRIESADAPMAAQLNVIIY